MVMKDDNTHYVIVSNIRNHLEDGVSIKCSVDCDDSFSTDVCYQIWLDINCILDDAISTHSIWR